VNKNKSDGFTLVRIEIIKEEYRPFFGLNKIEENWTRIQLNSSVTTFYDGDNLVKVIDNTLVLKDNGFLEGVYREFDTSDLTESRMYMLPKTDRGKKKKIIPSLILNMIPQGCNFHILIETKHPKSMIFLSNFRNHQEIRITGFDNVKTLDQINAFFDEFIQTCPSDYFKKIDRLRNARHTTVKYRVGDIFRFDVDRSHYGYGLIVASIPELKKEKLILPPHGLLMLMGQALIIRLYKISTDNPNLKNGDLKNIDLMPALAMMDNAIFWNTYPIVDHKPLSENDIDFPFQYGTILNDEGIKVLSVNWGIGRKIAAKADLSNIIGHGSKSNLGVSQIIPYYLLNNALMGGPGTNPHSDTRHPDNIGLYHAVLKVCELDPKISIDEFNRSCGGMTRKQYADFINFPKNQN